MSSASDRVRAEWRNRIAAEYGSAALTQHFVLWLIQIGASPDLIEDGLAIVHDELTHSQLSAEVYAEAGGSAPPAIDRASLALPRRPELPLEHDVLRAAIQVFCLNETVAVPLFAHLRDATTVPSARAALDRILVDEVRHRDFGWACLDWFLTTPMAPDVPRLVIAELPGLFAQLVDNYGAGGDGGITADDRTWGLAPPRDYAEILDACYARDYEPRFRARSIDPSPAWSARAGEEDLHRAAS
ncbi:MAG TPA: ferritin-like domain-containing protein [Kofleriaceae bacterium]|nr:ferritin-like domain-containing protein [Kofleriaceae bacterium]